MNERLIQCIAMDEGLECSREAVLRRPVPLCVEHGTEVALLIVPDVLSAAIRLSKSGASLKPLGRVERDALVAGARPLKVKPYYRGTHSPVVYFIENGDVVKIGFSTHLRARVLSLALQERNVVLLLEGGFTLEQVLHSRFEKDRIDNTEWFHLSDDMVQFITEKCEQLARRSRADVVPSDALDSQPAALPQPPKIVRLPAPKYPDGVDIEIKYRELWSLLGTYGAEGATAVELTAKQLDGFTSESNVRKQMRTWFGRKYIRSVKDGRASVGGVPIWLTSCHRRTPDAREELAWQEPPRPGLACPVRQQRADEGRAAEVAWPDLQQDVRRSRPRPGNRARSEAADADR